MADITKITVGSTTYNVKDAGASRSGHTHTTSIASSSATNQITLSASTKYAITAGGTSYVFTTPADTNTWRPQTDWNAASTANNAILNKPSLATVATSGSYNDLSNKPTIPAAQVQTDWNATSGMGVLLNKPSSLPASDVYSWAKASTKPSYTASEVGALKNYGNNASRPNGTTFTLPNGANPVQMRSGATSGADIGIFHLSDDNAFVCNSSDNSYLFAAFDTDKTADFSSADNAAFAVLSDHAGAKMKGDLAVAGSIMSGGTAVVLTNDSRMTNARPASDVYSWAKASTKPTYTYSEVGAASSGHTHDGRYIRWGGSAADVSAMSWGTLTTANGYTILSHTASSDGGDWGMCNKSGQIFMQLDGYYYQNEGRYRCLDTSDAASLSVNYANSAGSAPASDVYAWAKASSKPSYTASEVGAVPTSRTVNGKALSSNITLTASDVGAVTTDTKNTAGNQLVSTSSNTFYLLGTTSTSSTAGSYATSYTCDDRGYISDGKLYVWDIDVDGTGRFDGNLQCGYLQCNGNGTVSGTLAVTGAITQGGTAVVLTNDSRMTNARPASDVYSWAKASSKPSYTYSEVGAASSGHTHTTSIATTSDTNQITLAANTRYKLTAGGTSYVFTTPPSGGGGGGGGTAYTYTLNWGSQSYHVSFSGVPAGTYLFYMASCSDTMNTTYQISNQEVWGLDEGEGTSVFGALTQDVHWSDGSGRHNGTGYNIIIINSAGSDRGVNVKFASTLDETVYFKLVSLF